MNTTALDAAMNAIDLHAVNWRENARKRERARARDLIRRCTDTPAVFWNALFWSQHAGFHAVGTADLVQVAKRVRERQRYTAISGQRWRFDANTLAAAEQWELTARYFRRFGSRVWRA